MFLFCLLHKDCNIIHKYSLQGKPFSVWQYCDNIHIHLKHLHCLYYPHRSKRKLIAAAEAIAKKLTASLPRKRQPET